MGITTITHEEELMAREAIDIALRHGANAARVTLSKSLMDLIGTLDGHIDKVSHCLDRSLSICLFCDGKFGSFSTNRLEKDELEAFVKRAIGTVRMLAPDPSRMLPLKERKAADATTGKELGLYDSSYESIEADERVQRALSLCITGNASDFPATLVSEEGEYSDCCFDSIVMDSDGLYARHTETSFEYGVEVTVEDSEGNKYTGFWWEASPFLKNFDAKNCARKAMQKACAQIGAEPLESGKRNIVIDTEVASKVVSPVLNALGGYSIQQNNSFLRDSLGKKIFPESLTIIDECRRPGFTGSRLFDSEGISTKESEIISQGFVKQYFINTYISNKLGIAPTIEDVTRPKILPWPQKGLDRDAILSLCGDGILITGFNGGNSNSATGDFSFGIEGFEFKDGKLAAPVHEMLMTGNFIDLWNNMLAAGEDSRPCSSRCIPTLAFANVDISA